MTQRPSNWQRGWPAALLAVVLGVVALVLPMTWALSHWSYELPFLFRPNQPVDEVVLVHMDVPSEEKLGTGRWDRWDRRLHARLLGVLQRAGAHAVAFDVLFPRGTSDDANAALVAAARAHGRVAVAARPGAAIHAEGAVIGSALLRPFPELGEVAAWGLAEAADDTGTVREHVRDPDREVPSLAWRVLLLVTNQVPADPFAARWLNYYGPANHLPHVSYADALEPDFPAAATFSNKVVFVGAAWDVGFTGGTGVDYHRTPHTLTTGRKMPGVEVCATTYLNLRRGDWLRRPGVATELALIAAAGILLGLGLSALRPCPAAWVAGGVFLVLPVIAAMIQWTAGVWFPWLIVTAVQVPAVLGMTVLRQSSELQREKHALEQTLAMAQAGADLRRMESPSRSGPAAEPPREVWSPVGIGSSARPSGPSAAVHDLLQTPEPAGARTVPDHQLLKRIGRGAYGEVWIGKNIIGTHHAIKIVSRDAFGESEPYEREFKGVSLMAPISRQHPGFVHVLHVGRQDRDEYFYYVMELADNTTGPGPIQPERYAPRTLATELRERGRLPVARCLEIAIQLAEALEFLHQRGLIHRDVKPSNVIFVHGVPKFADIGLVTRVAATDHDVSYLGTRGYIAPEGPGTPGADVYSLGKVIYQAAFGLELGRFPELPTDIVVDPEESALFGLNHIILRACDASPAARYQTASELAQALKALRPPPGRS